MHKKYKGFLVDVEVITCRNFSSKIKGKYRKITLVNLHAPTEDKDEETKDKFYEELE